MEGHPAAPVNPFPVDPPPPAHAESLFDIIKSIIIRAVIIYFIISMPRRPPVPVQDPSTEFLDHHARLRSTQLHYNDKVYDLHVYISEEEWMPHFNNPKEFIWKLTGLTFGDVDYSKDVEISVPQVVQKCNGTYYLHTFLVKTGDSPSLNEFAPNKVTYHWSKKLDQAVLNVNFNYITISEKILIRKKDLLYSL